MSSSTTFRKKQCQTCHGGMKFQNPDSQSTLFDNLKSLILHPAYLMVFVQHVVLHFDASPVICYLHVDLILNRFGPKEVKKQFVAFYHTFLDKAGVLRVPVPTNVQFELDQNRPELIPDNQQRKYLQEIQNFQEPEIARQLEDFREKRKMGMTPGETELFELEGCQTKVRGIREAKEKQLAEILLLKLEAVHLTISDDEEKSAAIFTAIVGYMKHLGVKTKTIAHKKSIVKKISRAKNHEDVTYSNRSEFHCSDSQTGVDASPEQLLAEGQSSEDNGAESLEPGGTVRDQFPLTVLHHHSEETELQLPNWHDLAPTETRLRLKKREVKRQELINELFITEHAHLGMLRVFLEVFYQPLLTQAFFKERDLAKIFPCLESLVDEHQMFLENLKKLRQQNYIVYKIGNTLLAQFDGSEGRWFQKILARFCSYQSFAIKQLKLKQKNEPNFHNFIQEAESQPQCQRMKLMDIIPIEMQRLTKYPSLLHNIAICTEDNEERQKVERAAECCQQILNQVNQEVHNMENFLGVNTADARKSKYTEQVRNSFLPQIVNTLSNRSAKKILGKLEKSPSVQYDIDRHRRDNKPILKPSFLPWHEREVMPSDDFAPNSLKVVNSVPPCKGIIKENKEKRCTNKGTLNIMQQVCGDVHVNFTNCHFNM